jgi:hypothetical protein
MLDKVPKGADIRVKLWSDVPNDLDGALIRIRHVWHKPSVSEKEWIAHLEKEEAERAKRIREAEKREAERPKESPGKTPRIERVVTKRVSVPDGPPPPARVEVKPPQPSVHAEWVPGYWHWADLAAESERAESGRSRWVWIRGMWRVPEADVAGGLTARAPRPPPTARYEERPPAPVAAAVWTPGYWQWDGGAFVWIEGAWRVAPSGRHRWRAPTWRASASGAIFVPGGWIHLGH